MKFNALAELTGDGFTGVTVRWTKRIVVTIGAPSLPHCPIPVGACKACINRYFLNAFTKMLPDIFSIGIISLVITPVISHDRYKRVSISLCRILND